MTVYEKKLGFDLTSYFLVIQLILNAQDRRKLKIWGSRALQYFYKN